MTEVKKVNKKKPQASKAKKVKKVKTEEPKLMQEQSEVSHLTQTPTTVLGEVAWLMMQNPVHKYMYLADLEWLVIPAVTNKQFRLFKKDNIPVAYISWAYLDNDAENRLMSGAERLRPSDWTKGDEVKAWLIDVIAPFGGAEKFVQSLKEMQFSDKKLVSLQPGEGGKGMELIEISRNEKGAAA